MLFQWKPRRCCRGGRGGSRGVSSGRQYSFLLVVFLFSFLAVIKAWTNGSRAVAIGATEKPAPLLKTRLSDEVSIRASGRGQPLINLTDGREIITELSGPKPLVDAIEANRARPLSLASADFDEDGVRDLICGYGNRERGIISLYSGNVDSIYPDTRQARTRQAAGEFTAGAFLSPVRVFELPIAAEFIGTGDLDCDGHWDVVAAARGSDRLWWLRGDGHGSFGSPRAVSLPGTATALVTGDLNRRDGLEDLAVAISTGQGARVLVFQGRKGALNSAPEEIRLSAEATSLNLAQLDNDFYTDIAVTAGRELIVVHGRDRKLELREDDRKAVGPAKLSRRRFPFALKSALIGEYAGDLRPDVVVLSEDGSLYVVTAGSARSIGAIAAEGAEREAKRVPTKEISRWRVEDLRSGGAADRLLACLQVTGSGDDLLIGDRSRGELRVLTHPRKARDESSQSKRSSERTTPGVSIALETREAPVAALPMRLNRDGLSDLVVLQSGRSLPSLLATAPDLVITVNSTDDPGTVGDEELTLREAIRIANGELSLLSLSNAERAQVTGTVGSSSLIRFGIAGGTPLTLHTIAVTSPLPVIVKTMTIDGGEIESGDDPGNSSGPIELNGSRSSRPGSGLVIQSNNCVVRGLVINSFFGFLPPEGSGVLIDGDSNDATGNRVEGCFIGTDARGLAALPNSRGVLIQGARASNNIIGGTADGGRNVISGNGGDGDIFGDGVLVLNDPRANVILGNLIGPDVTGLAAIGNKSSGVEVLSDHENTIGGSEPGAGNIISGNRENGIHRTTSDDGTVFVFGNYIGLDITGVQALGNLSDGIFINFQNSDVIGGPGGARNVISGNGREGILIRPDEGGNPFTTIIEGNLIGTDATGTRSIGNRSNGIRATGGYRCSIAGNTISGNFENGVRFQSREAAQPVQDHIVRNFIGTNPGNQDLGNRSNGILIENKNTKHRIEDNVIAFNRATGVAIPDSNDEPATQITISENSIFTNGGLGIDIDKLGETPNDQGDPDMGANDIQNFPVLDSASSDDLNSTISGSLNSVAGHDFEIEFFANTPDSAPPQSPTPGSCPTRGQRFIGKTRIRTGGDGNATFTVVFASSTPGSFINATARDVTSSSDTTVGNTSEFSPCVESHGTGLSGADLAISNQTLGSVAPGDELKYEVMVSNSGPAPADDVVVTIGVPPHAVFKAALESAPSDWSCEFPGAGSTGFIICRNATLSVSDSARFAFAVTVDADAPDGITISSIARVSSITPERDPNNNSSEVRTRVTLKPPENADLLLETAGPSTAFPGDLLNYTLTLTNLGPAAATGVKIELRVPIDADFETGACLTGWDCAFPPAGPGRIVELNRLLSMPPLESETFRIGLGLKLNAVAGTAIRFAPTIRSDADHNSENDNAAVITAVVNRPAPPTITSIRITDTKITAIGSGFIKPVRVLIDGVEFNEPARVRGTRVTQTGSLRNGSSIGQAVRPGVLVTMTFRNGNGAEVTALFRR